MKKILPIAMIALAAMAVSCSNDDDNGLKNPTKDAISFSRPYVINSVKEKTGSTNIDFNSFYVWGFVNSPDSYIFDKNPVTLNGGNWVVNKNEYWYAGQEYYFSAIAPTSANIIFDKVTANADSYLGGGSIQFDNTVNPGKTDLVYAFSDKITAKDNGNTPVPLTFRHLLSRVMFTFTNNVSQSTSLVIKNLNLVGLYSKGTIDMNSSDAVWAPSDTDTELTIPDIKADSVFTHNNSTISDSRFIIPGTDTFNVSFDVEVYNGTQKVATYSHTVTITAFNFEMGNSYNFKTTFTGDNLNPAGALEPIKFTVTEVEAWDENNSEMPIPTPGN